MQPKPSVPSTRTSMFFAGRCSRVWVASTCSTSDVPMPKASAPIAPWVEVWLSPQTMVMPGRQMPSSGPMMCTMPCRTSRIGMYGTPNCDDVPLQGLDLDAAVLLLDAQTRDPWSGCCGRPPRWSHPGGAPAGPPGAAPRRPADWSPHGRDAGRCRARTCRPAAAPPHGCPRSCRTTSAACCQTSASPPRVELGWSSKARGLCPLDPHQGLALGTLPLVPCVRGVSRVRAGRLGRAGLGGDRAQARPIPAQTRPPQAARPGPETPPARTEENR